MLTSFNQTAIAAIATCSDKLTSTVNLQSIHHYFSLFASSYATWLNDKNAKHIFCFFCLWVALFVLFSFFKFLSCGFLIHRYRFITFRFFADFSLFLDISFFFSFFILSSCLIFPVSSDSRHKFSTCVYLRLCLARPCVHLGNDLRWLALTLMKDSHGQPSAFLRGWKIFELYF